jgi:hypothetical protein
MLVLLLLLLLLIILLVVGLAYGLRVRRYSRGHVVAELTVRGRGLYYSRTPDGIWWRIRLRARCGAPGPASPPVEPPDAGVREPRRPRGPRPPTLAARP